MRRSDVATADGQGGIWLIAEPVCAVIIFSVPRYAIRHGWHGIVEKSCNEV
jgi:hypothetical protein